jgi:NADH-quinone oxidoreductase subunit C
MTLQDAAAKVVEKFGIADDKKTEFRGEITLEVTREQIREVCQFCRDELNFNMLTDISSVDSFGEEPRFEIAYELYNMADVINMRLKLFLSEDDAVVPTINDIWRTADWHEREIYDMMGIQFSDHPDLRRILMWDGYPYHPLRKDFPLEGKPSQVPDVAFTSSAPLAGGPFVGPSTEATRAQSEPRANKRNDWDRTETGGQNSDTHKPRESGLRED